MACCCNKPKNKCNCKDCKIHPVCGCPCKDDCVWFPLEEDITCDRKMRLCCDQTGCCGMFPEDCRNTFWPDFTHPRWLCCKDLYCARRCKQCC